MVGGSASDNEHFLGLHQLASEKIIVDLMRSHRVPYRMDLLVDLLEHEMSETLFLGRLRVPRYLDRISFYRDTVSRLEDLDSIRVENGHFSFLQDQRFPGQW